MSTRNKATTSEFKSHAADNAHARVDVVCCCISQDVIGAGDAYKLGGVTYDVHSLAAMLTVHGPRMYDPITRQPLTEGDRWMLLGEILKRPALRERVSTRWRSLRHTKHVLYDGDDYVHRRQAYVFARNPTRRDRLCGFALCWFSAFILWIMISFIQEHIGKPWPTSQLHACWVPS